MKSETLSICQVSLAGNIPIIKQNIEKFIGIGNEYEWIVNF